MIRIRKMPRTHHQHTEVFQTAVIGGQSAREDMCHLLAALHVITVHGPDFRAKFLIHNELSWRINIAP